ncbi:MAG: hypothetical protein Q4G43_03230 [Mobilicoccus sp.]|nr:hypothetical protein [Mobilicoccus sp.]
MDQARLKAVSECMMRAGFPDYRAPEPLSSHWADDGASLPEFGDGTLDPEGAPGAPPDQTPPPSPAEQEALDGSGTLIEVTSADGQVASTGKDGCWAEGDLAVLGGEEGYRERTLTLMALRNLQVEAEQRFMEDSSVQETRRAWSDCMGSRGWKVASSSELASLQPIGTEWSQWAGAQDGVACTADVNAIATLMPIMVEKERAVLAEQPGVGTAWQETQARIIANAKAVLGVA